MEMRRIDLRAAAAVEAARIAAARAIVRNGDEAAREWLDVRRPWMAFAGTGRRRAALRGRAVLIWQVAAEDSCGSVAISAIATVMVDLAAAGDSRSRRTIAMDAVARIQRCPPEPIAAFLREKTEPIIAVARAFANARLERARAVAACASRRTDDDRFQPGLFDRRAERARLIALAAGEDGTEAADARVAAAAAAADLRPAPPALLLVLTA